MCRSIKTLYHLDPPTDTQEIGAAARQFVRKVSGFTRPSQKNTPAFESAIEEITAVTERLFAALETNTPPRDRAVLEERAKARSAARAAERRSS